MKNGITAKRILACMLAVVMALLCFDIATAKAKPKLSRKSMSITKGHTAVLKVKNAGRKVYWNSTYKKVAAVIKISGKKNATAVIKAKNIGKCTIRAKVGKKVLKCTVVVRRKGAVSWPIYDDTEESERDRVIKKRALSASAKELSGKYAKASASGDALTDTARTSVAGFALDLFKETVKADETGKNILISPDSVMTALAMTENGAAGNTKKEMADTVHKGLDNDTFNAGLAKMHDRLTSDKNVIYTTANSIWSQQGAIDVKDEFVKKNKNLFGAQYYEAPFDDVTVADMNNWVYNNTRNMIEKIIDSLEKKDDRMILMNAVAFEGKWGNVFEDYQVKTEEFTKEDGTKQTVTMLNGKEYDYLTLAGGKGFAKSYRGNNFAFVGLLPPEGMKLDTYISKLTGEGFRNAWKDRSDEKVYIKIPEFKYDYYVSLGDVLKEMGIEEAFTDDADFTGMFTPTFDTPGLKIGKVLHKTHIDLDRYGTKAAAVTVVGMVKTGAAPQIEPPKEVYLTRPFVYSIIDTKSGLPMFIGAVRSVK